MEATGMDLRRVVVLASLLLCAAACGDDRDPPSSVIWSPSHHSVGARPAPDGPCRTDHPCVGSVRGNTIAVHTTHPDCALAQESSGLGSSSMTCVDLEMRRL
jgi:hypothetical protein